MKKECKKCGSKNLYLEPRIKGQDVLTADMVVALKCKDCDSWLKWCPKDERQFYLNKQSKDKWQKLKEWLDRVFQIYLNESDHKMMSIYGTILDKMQELEAEDE